MSKGSYEIRSVVLLKFHPIGGAMKQLGWTDCLNTLPGNNFLSTLPLSAEERASLWDAKLASFCITRPPKITSLTTNVKNTSQYRICFRVPSHFCARHSAKNICASLFQTFWPKTPSHMMGVDKPLL